MDPSEILRIVDTIHRDKNIDKEIVFEGIEAALVSAAKRHYGEESEVIVQIDRKSGAITGTCNGVPLSPAEMAERIGAQTAKQVMIQKIREAERDQLFDEYEQIRGQLVTGVVQRYEGGAATVSLGNVEAILPRSEQIPGEQHHANERVRATVYEVKKAGSRVKVILSRTKPHLVQRLFEQEIPEIAEGVIEIRAISREPGYRTKVAVSSTDQRVDCVGACVGVRGNRIKNIVDELGGSERIDIVRYSDDMQVLIPNALQPAEVEEVILCQMLGRAIVLVREDQLSLAIGRRGQNVRLASKLCGWDIEIMTREELDEQIEQAVMGFSSLEGVESELAERLVGEGFLTYDDLSVIEPDSLMEMGGLTEEQVERIVAQAEEKALEAEQLAAEQRRQRREQEKLAAGRDEGEPSASGESQTPKTASDETVNEEEAAETLAADETAADDSASDDAAAGNVAEDEHSVASPESTDERENVHPPRDAAAAGSAESQTPGDEQSPASDTSHEQRERAAANGSSTSASVESGGEAPPSDAEHQDTNSASNAPA